MNNDRVNLMTDADVQIFIGLSMPNRSNTLPHFDGEYAVSLTSNYG